MRADVEPKAASSTRRGSINGVPAASMESSTRPATSKGDVNASEASVGLYDIHDGSGYEMDRLLSKPDDRVRLKRK